MLNNKTIFGIFAFSILSFLGFPRCFGQEVLKLDKNVLTNFDIRIKQFNEFIDRFNFITDFKGENISSAFKSKVRRIDYLKILFNLQDPRLYINNPSFSNNYNNLVQEFVLQISKDSIFISKYSDRIIAVAKTRIIYNNIPKDISIYLCREIVGGNMIKWVIVSVYAEFLNIVKEDTSFVRFIPPNSHELDFMNMKRALQDKEHLDDYAKKGYVYDPLSVFFFNIYCGNLVIDYIREVNYYIFDIPGWCFKVKDFDRPGSNSGWLIDNVWKTNEDPIHFLNSF